MTKRKVSRKVISIVVSLLMIVGMIPMGAFVATAATAPVYSSGDWIVPEGTWNGNMNGFSNNGAQPAYSTIGIHDTNYVFMQTEDNQAFTYTVNMYVKRNAFTNHVKMMSLDTNYNGSADDFVPLITSEYWYCNSGDTVRWVNGSTFPEDVEFNSTTAIPVTYTVEFNAAGSAVYHPEWTMVVRTRSYQFDSYSNYYMNALNYNGSTDNYDPVFTVQVIDLREVRTLISIAQNLGLTVSDYTGGRDFSGATYYSQQTVDEVVAALRQALLCDYSYLDAQLARAAAVDPNYEGGLGYNLFDDSLYAAFESAYADAQAVDRFLMSDGTGTNEAIIAAAASALDDALDALLASRKALITFYDGTDLIGRNVVDPADGYNLHDTVHKRGNEYFITVPEKTGYVFDYWTDAGNNKIDESTVITGDMTVYAKYKVKLNGIAPLSSSGRWDHVMVNTTDPDADYYMWGENYVTMWVEDTQFNFMQTQDNEVFSFYTDFTAVKNQGSNYARINSVYLLNDAETNAFVDRLDGTNGIEVHCITPQFGNGDMPSENDTTGNGKPDGLLPAIPLNNHASQMSAYFVTWRYIYAFGGNGAATYHPKWNINYNSGGQDAVGGSVFSTQYDLTDSGDSYVNFTINVSDARGLINAINKAESVLNNSNAGFTESERNSLRAILDDINANYVLDGSVYYTQTDIDTQTARIKAIIPDDMTVPCDYTELDAAVALAEQKIAEYNNNTNNHFIDEVWNDFMTAYTAASDIANSAERPLDILPDNSNQTAIDNATAELLRAINALIYKSHVNEPCEYDPIDTLVDDAIATYGDDITDNSDGQYDDQAYQDYLDALEHAQDVINTEYYVDSDGNNDNQQIIDDALQDLQDAIDNLNNPANQNDPCDYTELDAAIAAAQSITNNDLFTAATYQALQDALTDALAVPTGLYDDDNGVNQQTIDDATDALIAAIDALLADAVANAQNTDTTGMDAATVDDLNDAIDAAEDVAADPTSTAQDKADAINDITTALDNLTVDKTKLEDAIAAGLNVDTDGIDQTLVDALNDAISDGQTVDADSNATVQEVADATQAIVDALADILTDVINDAQNTDTTGMTDQSIDDLTQAITDAQTVLSNPDATADEIADAITDIQNAVDSLTPDKTELQEAVDAAETVDPSNLDPAVASDLQDAIDNGNNVLNDPDATVQEVQDAIDQINDVLDQILQDAIDDANNIDTTGMDPTTVADLDQAIQDAEDILNDPDSTAQEKADAINDIINAVDGLTVDKTELEIAIYSANNTDTTGVPQNLVDALDAAVANGQTVDADTDATVQEVADATEQIKDAIADILAQLISDAQNTDTTGMTSNSIQDLADAIDNAQSTLNDVDSNSYNLAEAVNDLQTALNDLEADKTELEELINLASAIDTNNIDPAVVAVLEDAIADGEAVDANADATVAAVADAVQALKDAIDDVLQSVVDEAQNIDTTGMTAISAANFDDALAAAEELLANGGDAQDKVDAINALVDAINDLNADKTELEYAIDAGEAIDTTDIPQNLVDALENALTDGNVVDADTNATVQEVSDATDAITDAIADILAEVISQAENTDTTGMTDQSIVDLEQAIADAQAVLADPDSTAEELADAIADIQNAVDSLTPDKTELQDAVDAAETIDPTNLDPTVAQDLQDAIENGNNVLNDPDATVQEIQDAIDQINDVIDQILQDAITDAEDIVNNPDGYDPSTISDLQDAIDAAENILNDSDSTADDKVNALDDLQAALDNVTVDKSALAAAIALAENTDTLGYEVAGVQALLDAVDDGRDVYDNDAATVAEVAAATQAILDAIDGLTVDKTDLAQKISEAQTAAADPTYEHDAAMDALNQAIADATDVYNDPDATVQEVWDAIQALDDAMMDLNVVPPMENVIISVFDDEGNSICDISVDVTYGNNILFSDIESQLPTDLSAYIGADEVFLGWTDANGDFYDYGAYGIIDRANPQIHLTTQLTKITAGTGTDVTIDRYSENSTNYTYMVGLDSTGTTADDLKAQLQNRSTEIIIERDGYEILSTDLVGTGCLVKCVNALDHSIVYEVATVILYGDVNGDGLVDTEDKAIIYNDAFFGESVLTAGTVYYIAGDLAKDGTLDAFDYFYVDGIATGGREFDQTSELYR